MEISRFVTEAWTKNENVGKKLKDRTPKMK